MADCIIFQELCLGIAKPGTRETYLRIIDQVAKQGAEAVILGCTEIGMLIEQKDTSVKLFDTTAIHAQKRCSMRCSADRQRKKLNDCLLRNRLFKVSKLYCNAIREAR